jgi:hypothetical protein
MKWPRFVSLLATLNLSSCTTMHDAAVSTFRVVDAPNAYIRRKLGIDQEQPAATTTTTTTTQTTGVPPNQQPQPYQTYPPPQPPPPPIQAQNHLVTSETKRQPPAEAHPTATPRVVETETRTSESKPDGSTQRTASTQTSDDLPYAKPVPGKPGYVFSPYDPNGGYVDVKGYSPGQKVKDPYSGKIFLVP